MGGNTVKNDKMNRRKFLKNIGSGVAALIVIGMADYLYQNPCGKLSTDRKSNHFSSEKMGNRIYYFTGTGNSLKVARELAAGIGGAELVRITRKTVLDHESMEFDRVGIVSPVYMGGLPKMVVEFLEQLNINENAYIFTAVSCGSKATRGISLLQARGIMLKKDRHVKAEFVFALPKSNQTSYAPIPEAKQQKMFKANEADIKEAIDILAQYGTVRSASIPIIGSLSKMAQNHWQPHKTDVDFYAENNCVGCGTCVSVCPAHNIEIVNAKPTWKQQCERCTACLQLCPKQAIQFTEKTKKWGRYRHPDVSVRDLRILT